MTVKNARSLLECGTVVWCATEGGLSRFEDGQGLREENFPKSSAKCLALVGQSDKPWCGTSAGLVHWSLGRWQVVPELTNRDVRSLAFEEAEQVVWCGTNRGLAERRNGRWDFPASDVLPDLCINCLLYEGGEGRAQPILWCGTEQGLATFDGRSFELVLSDLNITSLIRDRKGAVWCGTGKGLQYKPADGGAWQSVNWSERVECLLVDRAGGVWCGTQEALRHFDGSRWQVLHADGFLMGVQCLLEDRHGRIWCGTHKELVILRPQGNNLYVPVALEEALNPPVPEVPPPVFAASMTGESTDRSPKNSTPVRPPQVADEHKREPFPPKAPQAVSDTQPPKNPQPLPQPSSPPEGLVKTKQAFRYPSFALPSGEQLNWLAVAALILAVFATGNWLESKNTAQVPTAKPTGVPANPKMSGPTASKSGIAVLSPVETVQEFYKTASTKGYLREDLTTQSLRSAVAAQPEIVMQRGNFLGIDPGSVRQSDSAGQKEVQFVLQVRARPPLERAVQFDYANSRWRLPTSMRLIFSGGRWKIDRVRYSAKKRCNTGRSATFFFSDTEYFQAGHPIPGRQLPNPCYLQAGTARPTQY